MTARIPLLRCAFYTAALILAAWTGRAEAQSPHLGGMAGGTGGFAGGMPGMGNMPGLSPFFFNPFSGNGGMSMAGNGGGQMMQQQMMAMQMMMMAGMAGGYGGGGMSPGMYPGMMPQMMGGGFADDPDEQPKPKRRIRRAPRADAGKQKARPVKQAAAKKRRR